MLFRDSLWFPHEDDDDPQGPEGFGLGERSFIHKSRFVRGLTSVVRRVAAPAIGLLPIPGASIISSALSSRPPAPAAQVRAVQQANATTLKFQMPGCQPPARLNPSTGQCEVPRGGFIGRAQRFLPGGFSGFVADPSTDLATVDRTGRADFGMAVMGRFGVALEPAVISAVRLQCPPGAVLGRDNLCYDHIRKSDRKWPPGRRPLLTGGQMNAIAIAGRAAGRLKRTGAKLRKLGLKC